MSAPQASESQHFSQNAEGKIYSSAFLLPRTPVTGRADFSNP